MVASVAHNHEVVGSIPTSATKKTIISPIIQITGVCKWGFRVIRWAKNRVKRLCLNHFCIVKMIYKSIQNYTDRRTDIF